MTLLDKTKIQKLLLERFKDEKFKTAKDIPHPFCFAGMEEAVALIMDSIKHKKEITIVGDYDVDGVVGTTILANFFDAIGYPYHFVIPNRFRDGYGFSEGILQRIKADLIITVDNGITAHQAALACKEKGIKLIITDHHTPAETLPCADVIVNPRLPHCLFPQKEICGANVAWYLSAALKQKMSLEYDMNISLDILALAIIADVMPLIGINRLLLKKGLKIMQTSMRPAFVVLRESLKKTAFNSEDVAFQIAPLLNSAGRMDDALLSVKFLMSKDVREAKIYFEKLKALNQERKEIENYLFEQALLQTKKDSPIAIVYGKDWHEGVLGIVAARLCDRLEVPSFVMTLKQDGVLKGSGRSVGEINLIELLRTQAPVLKRFGGHKGAVGLEMNLKDLQGFKENLQNILEKNPNKQQDFKTKGCMGEIALNHIDSELLEILDGFEPYGEANPKPRFMGRGLVIKNIKSVGVHQNHTSLVLEDSHYKQSFRAIAFNQQYTLGVGESVDTLFMLSRDSYAKDMPQLIIENLNERL